MGLFDFLKRTRGVAAENRAEPQEKSRIDFLLETAREQLEGTNEAFGGLNFLQLVEKQIEEGQIGLATWNITTQVKGCFELANLYWEQGDLVQAEAYLRQTLERDQRLVRACVECNLPAKAYCGVEYAKCAACLLGNDERFPRAEAFEPGYEPELINMLLNYCLDSRDFDMSAWQTATDAWTRRRHPKYRIEEFTVYVKALTGAYGSTEEMLGAHARMLAGRAKRNPDADLLDGIRIMH